MERQRHPRGPGGASAAWRPSRGGRSTRRRCWPAEARRRESMPPPPRRRLKAAKPQKYNAFKVELGQADDHPALQTVAAIGLRRMPGGARWTRGRRRAGRRVMEASECMRSRTSNTRLPAVGKPIDRTDGRAKVTGTARSTRPISRRATRPRRRVPQHHRQGAGEIDRHDRRRKIRRASWRSSPTRTPTNSTRCRWNTDPARPGQTWLPVQDDAGPLRRAVSGPGRRRDLCPGAARGGLVQRRIRTSRSRHTKLKDVLDQAFTPKKMAAATSPTHRAASRTRRWRAAAVKVDQTYTTPTENHNPMEMYATIAAWEGDKLTLYDATQWVYGVRAVRGDVAGDRRRKGARDRPVRRRRVRVQGIDLAARSAWRRWRRNK